MSQILAKHDDAFVYAGARDPQESAALKELETRYHGRIAVVKYIAADVQGNRAIAEEIRERHGRVDTVIANSGTYLRFMLSKDPVALGYFVTSLRNILHSARK